MDREDLPTLIDRLKRCTELWAKAQNASPARLGRLVVNDGGFFTRLESQTKGTTTDTLERFARFLADVDNWPDGAVPDEALQFAHVTGVAPMARDAA